MTPILFRFACAILFEADRIEPPAFDRPPGFSFIVGKYSKPRVNAEPIEIHVEEPITLRITITGEGPANFEPGRWQKGKHVRQLLPDSIERDFFVQEMRDQHKIDPANRTWTFIFRLRPKNDKVTEIDGVRLVYYDPEFSGKQKYRRLFATPMPIAIKVTPKPADSEKLTVEPEAIPASFYQTSHCSVILSERPTLAISVWHIVLALASPPLICLAGVFAWRRWCPDDIQLAHTRRVSAAVLALERLRAGHVSTWITVRIYLTERLGLEVADPGPAEIHGFLKRKGFEKAACELARTFFQTCDAQQFANREASPAMVHDAIRLIETLEADPCVRF